MAVMLGIQDRKVLACITKMLKAEIDGEGIPTEGVPQDGLLSTLLLNIVPNDLDQWGAGQWEFFPLSKPFKSKVGERSTKKRTHLKEGYLVCYADDIKILCKDGKTAQKWYHVVRQYLKDRLKLDISPEKSRIVNLRKRESEFLGFTIRAIKKEKKRVAHTGIKADKKRKIKEGAEKFKFAGVYLFPLADVKTVNTMGFSPKMTPFTKEGGETIHKRLRPDIQREIGVLMKSTLSDRVLNIWIIGSDGIV